VWHVVFVDPQYRNSATIIAALERTLDNIKFCSHSDISSAQQEVLDRPDWQPIVVADGKSALPQAYTTLRSLALEQQCSVVCAYESLTQAREVVTGGHYPSVFQGFFPWRSGFDLQRSIFRCLQIGLRTLPYGLDVGWPLETILARANLDKIELHDLTRDEKDVLKLFAAGDSASEIAITLDETEEAIKVQIQNALAKIDIHKENRFSNIEARYWDQ
jgi:DNA-binding CsgD family transcriptional regulator